MSEFRAENFVDTLKVETITNLGEITVGGTSDINRVIVAALANMNNPLVNEVLLAFKVKFTDRLTKTPVFPREGMSLPNGEVYVIEKKEEQETPSGEDN